MKSYLWDKKGFTLAEMAVVVLLIGIAMTMGLKMVTATLQNAAYSETKSKQERIKLALIGYLRTNGKLPCPDITTNPTNTSYGLQDRTSGTDSTCSPPNTTIQVLPWRDLGMSRDAVQDGWGNFFTYRVANNADAINWTSKTAGTPFDIDQLTHSVEANVLNIQERNGSTLQSITTPNGAIVSIVSHGKNGLGARTIKGSIITNPTGVDEAENSDADATFITRPYTDDTTATGGAYDDLVTYMTPQDLLHPLLSEGTLKTCIAYCSSSNLPCNTVAFIPVGNSPITCQP
ncbi:MAG: type II secretion system protein [Pseudomonadota bacterium]